MVTSRRIDVAEIKRLRDVLSRRQEVIRRELDDPSARTPIRYRFFAQGALELAAATILLDVNDAVVREHIQEAVGAAQAWLISPTGPSHRLKTGSIEATVDASGKVEATITKLDPPTPPPGSRDGWFVDLYSQMLLILVAFGSGNAARDAAAAREEWYRSAEVLAEEAYFAEVRGRKHWLLGEDEAARAASREAMRRARDASIKAAAAALLAWMEGKERAFRAGLADLLKAHKNAAGEHQGKTRSPFRRHTDKDDSSTPR